MSAPSASRWSAFSVRPPSAASDLGVGDGVEAERRVEVVAQRRPGSVRIVVDRCAPAAPDGVARPGGRGSAGSPRSVEPGARASSGVRPRDTRARVARRGAPTSMRARPAQVGHGLGRHAAADAGRAAGRAGSASPVIRRPPAGWTSSRHEPPVRGRRAPRPSLVGDERARRVVRSPAATRAAQTTSRPDRRLEERARPRLVGADLALELDRRPRRDRAGRPRAGAAGSASRPSLGCGVGGELAAEPRAERSRRAGRPRSTARRASSSGAVSSPSSGDAAPGRRSGPCRGPRPSASA